VGADLATEIKSYALQTLDFDLVGITTAEPLAGGAHLRAWLTDGRHGEMVYMAKAASVRCDPGQFLPGARSVICVAMSYHDAAEAPQLRHGDDRVVIARYARRRDYHKVIKHRLVRLGRFLAQRSPDAAWRAAVDTAPLLEKELAQRAGLGWIGKNTCLLNRRLGIELLLGELVTTLALPTDPPETDHCGTCTACLAACPTAAFDAPHRLDPRRCIAYLTIEHRSEMPIPLLGAFGAHVFGCDVCQAVCPWNRRATPHCAAPLEARSDLTNLSFRSLAVLDRAGWERLAAGTPLRRLDYPRLGRNLAAVATNLADRQGAAEW
jgi:epoxyqueuosine reductase